MEILGTAPVLTPAEVNAKVQAAKAAQKVWQTTTFAERRRVLRTLLHYIVNHQKDLSDVSILETGKTAVDSAFGEVFITCEKIKYILNYGECYLQREYRNPGMLMLHKKAWVDYVPCGVVGLIVPWNFPVHNVLSHVVTALFAGNACVIKVSEWASWSHIYMQNMIHGLLKATGVSVILKAFFVVLSFVSTVNCLMSLLFC
jgi:acyl-CoA reductase-like NAD-dependent aldehyde dehydrogenase